VLYCAERSGAGPFWGGGETGFFRKKGVEEGAGCHAEFLPLPPTPLPQACAHPKLALDRGERSLHHVKGDVLTGEFKEELRAEWGA